MVKKNRRITQSLIGVAVILASFTLGCKTPAPIAPDRPMPDISPTSQSKSDQVLHLDASQIEPMYQQLLAIDLETVVRIAQADNTDILLARQEIEVRQGQVQSSIGAIFPALVPSMFFQDIQGTKQATEGNLVGVGFNTFQPGIALQWIINPGKVYYDIIAAKKRLAASEFQEKSVIVKTLGTAAVQYYGLVLSQAQIEVAQQAVMESQELLRINQLREKTGTGITGDVLTAQAHLAEREQNLFKAINAFYNASVDLALTLRLDASVTLIPKIKNLSLVTLVRKDLDLDALIALAVDYRPDLEQVRLLVASISAETDATWWGAYGPEFQAGYRFSGIKTNEGDDTSWNDQRHFTARTGWRWSVSSFGNLKSSKAIEKQAMIKADLKLEEVRAEVIRALQKSRMNDKLVTKSDLQLLAAQEAFRLTQVSFKNGLMITLNVLEAEDALARANLHFAQAIVGYNQAQVHLSMALGIINVETLSNN